MKNRLEEIINQALIKAYKNGELPSENFPDVHIEIPKIDEHGDFSTNIAMMMAKVQKMAPFKIAETIIKNIDNNDSIIDRNEIAEPGFINFFIKPSAWHSVLIDIYKQGQTYGSTNIGKGKGIQVEFVSANPTGPLHVGHGRGAAIGDSVGNILSYCGFDVQKEYYINDSGNQINTLGRSVLYRYRESFGEQVDFPEDCYQGEYIKDIADLIKNEKKDTLLETDEIESVQFCAKFSSEYILKWIRRDLESFGVSFDNWFSEQSLYDFGKVNKVIDDLKNQDIIYEKENALWFNTEKYGDEKDRVVVKSDGQTTYFASDIAYHLDKFDRGFDRVINVWGADHHGYISRINASIEATGKKSDQFDVILVKLVNLLKGGEPIAMGKRSGKFVTLSDVVDEVGKDAARFIFLTRHYESPLDFDIEIAKKKSNDNPVFYVQYVHARISSIIRKAAEEKNIHKIEWDDHAVSMLKEPEDLALIRSLEEYPEVVRDSAIYMEPHRITFYLMNLSSLFHTYYNKHKVLTDDSNLTKGRLYLIFAVKKVIFNGLSLLNVSAPEKM